LEWNPFERGGAKGAAPLAASRRGLPASAKRVLRAFARLFDAGRTVSPPLVPGVRLDAPAVTVAALRAMAFELGVYSGEEPGPDAPKKDRDTFRNSRNKAFRDGLERLESDGLLRVEQGLVWDPNVATGEEVFLLT
jgi:hypothetical protein